MSNHILPHTPLLEEESKSRRRMMDTAVSNSEYAIRRITKMNQKACVVFLRATQTILKLQGKSQGNLYKKYGGRK